VEAVEVEAAAAGRPYVKNMSIATSTLRYSHLTPAHKRKAVDLLDEALNEQKCVQSAR
jgi:hypothetical protein